MIRNFSIGATLSAWLLFSVGGLGFSLGLSGAEQGAVTPKFKKVMIVIFENTDYSDALKQPFFKKLSKEGVLLDNFHAETHPSQPNYIALVSGDMHGVTDDDNVDLDAGHIGDLLEAKGLQWKVYAEAYPGNCFLGEQSGTYVRKHVPLLSFKNIQSDPKRCGRIVNASELEKDIRHGTVPEFSLYIPDLNNDGHDTDAKFADRWYGQTFGPMLQNRAFMKDLLLVSTFDESWIFGFNHIYTSLYGDSVTSGAVSSERYDHYSLLRTIEDAFHLGNLGQNDVSATPIQNIWR